MFDLGDIIPLTVEVRDSNAALANATAVTLTIGLPDGTTTSPTPTNATTGRYQCDYAPPLPGHYSVQWLATGSNASGYPEAFDVRPAVPGMIVSLADTKTHLNIPASDTTNDEQIRNYIESATAIVEHYRNEIITRRTVTEYHNPKWLYKLVLRTGPVISLTSIGRVDGTLTWDITRLNVQRETGEVTIPGADSFVGMPSGIGGFWGYLKVVYLAGYPVIPPNLTLAAKYIVENLWASQQQSGVGPGGPFANESAGDQGVTGSGYAMPYRALELLAGKSPGFA